ncbi:MAG: hypothetical protein JW881_03065 [Spirochaetales bacterium]|nr:hypothetical protein [Spirochaetales bacterium]
MKRTMKTITIVFVSILPLLLPSGCEPNDWDIIMAAPPPVENLSIFSHSGDDIIFAFTLPDFSEKHEVFSKFEFHVYIYSRPASGGEETYHSSDYFDQSQIGTDQTIMDTFTGLTGGTQYIFILYVVDTEFQKSDPVETLPVNW